MPGFGSKFRIKRLALGLSLKDASRKTRIKQKELDALEEEEILKFKDKETALDHARTYAATLDLDRNEIIADLESLWSDSSTAKLYMHQQHKRENRFVAFREQKFLSYGTIVAVIAILLSVGGYMFWNSLYNFGEPEQYYATSAAEVVSEEAAAEEPEIDDVEDIPITQQEALDDNDQEQINFLSDTEDDKIVDAIKEPDNNISEEPVLDADDDNGLPTTGGLAYMIWFGILTFIVGLALFLPALLFNKECDPVLGPPN